MIRSRHRNDRPAAGLIGLLGLSVLAFGCASAASTTWTRRPIPSTLPAAGPVFVLEPILEANAHSRSNIGFDFHAVSLALALRILEVVRERYPRAEIIGAGQPAARPLGFDTRDGAITPVMDLATAAFAARQGATHVLVPAIVKWQEMRTDDPVGALILPHNEIVVDLRLVDLPHATLVGAVTFRNRAHLTLNQRAGRLLDGDFRKAVLRLLSGG